MRIELARTPLSTQDSMLYLDWACSLPFLPQFPLCVIARPSAPHAFSPTLSTQGTDPHPKRPLCTNKGYSLPPPLTPGRKRRSATQVWLRARSALCSRPPRRASLPTDCGPNASPLPLGRPPSSRQPVKALEAEVPRGTQWVIVMQGWLGKARERDGGRTRPWDEAAVHAPETRCNAAPRRRGSHRADTAPAASPRARLVHTLNLPVFCRVRPSGLQARQQRRANPRPVGFCRLAPPPPPPALPIGCREQVAGPAERTPKRRLPAVRADGNSGGAGSSFAAGSFLARAPACWRLLHAAKPSPGPPKEAR